MNSVLQVNPITCKAHGLCAELFPERISLDDWGYPIVDPRPITPELLDHARRAVDACPTLALLLVRAQENATDAGQRKPLDASRLRRTSYPRI